MKIYLLLVTFLVLSFFKLIGQINLAAGSTYTESFNSLGSSTTASLPSNWKALKSNTANLTTMAYSSGVTGVELAAGNSMSTTAANGIYRLNAANSTSESALGGLSSGSASKSVCFMAYFTNSGSNSITHFTIDYSVEKFRNGSNSAGFSIQLLYSTDGTTWTSCGTNFITSFSADANNNGYTTAPTSSTPVSATYTPASNITAASAFYLCWRYSVTSGTTTSNAQALGFDDVSITAYPLSPSISTPNPTSLTGFSTSTGTASVQQAFTISGTNLSDDITVTAPTNFEVSTDNLTYSGSVVLTQSSGSVSTTTIYTRISSSAGIGYPSGNITCSSTNASNQLVAVDGQVLSNNSNASDVIVNPSYVYNQNVNYALYNGSGLTSTNSIDLAEFTIRDGGASSDGDALTTTLNSIQFVINHSAQLDYLGLFDGTTLLQEVASSDTIEFTGLNLYAADNSSKSFTLRSTFENNVTDNTQIQLTIIGCSSAANGSQFSQIDAGGAITSNTGDDNKIEVNATQLNFLVQPTSTVVNQAAAANVQIKAIDANQNLDLDFANSVVLTSTGTMTGDPLSISASNGIASFSITHTETGTNLTLTASSTGLSDATSSSFDIFSSPISLASWNFFGLSNVATATATTLDSNLVQTTGQLSRGSSAASSAGSNSFRTTGFQNNGIATSNSDYFQFNLKVQPGYTLSIYSIDAICTGTSSFYASSGVTSQFAYSLDGTNYTLIGSASTTTSLTLPTVLTNGISALQGVSEHLTIYFRYYASGQTTTGGWGFSSSSNSIDGLTIKGFIDSKSPSTYTFNGSLWNPANPELTSSIVDEVVINAGAVVLSNPVSCNVLSIANGAELIISNDESVTVNGSLTNNGEITIENTGALIQGSSSTIAGSGTYNVNKTATPASGVLRYDFWGSPITAGDVSILGALGGNRYWYDPSAATSDLAAGWQAASGTMVVGRGYIATNSGDVTFTGTVNNGNITYAAVTETNTGVNIENIISNPYPSGLDLTLFAAANVGASQLTSSFYFWDDKGTAGNYGTDGYATFNSSGATWTAAGFNGSSAIPSNNIIASGQGFVAVPGASAPASFNVSFTNSMRSANTSTFYRNVSDRQRFWVQLTKDSTHFSEMAVVVNTDATESYDEIYDSKRLDASSVATSINAYYDNTLVVIKSLPAFSSRKQVPLSINISEDGLYKFAVSKSDNIDGLKIFLFDNLTGMAHLISNNNEHLQLLTVGSYFDRFYLVFDEVENAGTAIEEVHSIQYSITPRDIILTNINEPMSYEVYSLNSQLLEQANLTTNSIDLSTYSTGIYLVKLKTASTTETIKFARH